MLRKALIFSKGDTQHKFNLTANLQKFYRAYLNVDLYMFGTSLKVNCPTVWGFFKSCVVKIHSFQHLKSVKTFSSSSHAVLRFHLAAFHSNKQIRHAFYCLNAWFFKICVSSCRNIHTVFFRHVIYFATSIKIVLDLWWEFSSYSYSSLNI